MTRGWGTESLFFFLKKEQSLQDNLSAVTANLLRLAMSNLQCVMYSISVLHKYRLTLFVTRDSFSCPSLSISIIHSLCNGIAKNPFGKTEKETPVPEGLAKIEPTCSLQPNLYQLRHKKKKEKSAALKSPSG